VYDRVEIIFGVCLFSAEILCSSVLEDGGVDVQKLLDAKPTFYEMDFIARSSSALADVAPIVILQGKASEERSQPGFSVPIAITLDVPSFHYYQSIEEKFEQGLCTASQALQWIKAIEKCHDQVAAVFEKISALRAKPARCCATVRLRDSCLAKIHLGCLFHSPSSTSWKKLFSR
jgi:hypothetical protein